MDDNDFFEEDESPDQIRWAFQHGEKGRTKGTKRLSWRHRWMLWRAMRRWSHPSSRFRRFVRRWSPRHLRAGLAQLADDIERHEDPEVMHDSAGYWLRGEIHLGRHSFYRDYFETRPVTKEELASEPPFFSDPEREETDTDP